MTFQARLTLSHLGLLVVSLIAMGVGVYTVVARVEREGLHDSLRQEARRWADLASTVDKEDRLDDALAMFPASPDMFVDVSVATEVAAGPPPDSEQPAKTRVTYVSRHRSDTLLAQGLPKEVPEGQVVVRQTSVGLLALYAERFAGGREPPNRRYRDLREGPSPNRFQGKVVVGRPLAPMESSLAFLRAILAGGGAVILAVAALLTRGISAALLQPLARMRDTAQRIGDARDFSRRMGVDNPRDELGRLSIAFNRMLAELERAHGDLAATLEAQRRFVADASHELRTPMTTIRTNLEFLNRVPAAREEDRKEAIGDTLAEVRRMEALVGDLLALARLESGAPRPHRRLIRLDRLLVEAHREALRHAHEGVEVRLGPVVEAWVKGDRDDLRRALWNLVDNALKYTPQGTVELSMRVHEAVAEVTVSDTGIGIDPAYQRLVFDRFWRAPGVRGSPGSGLGLAITRWVVQTHGGSIELRSQPGAGATFTIRLPVTTTRHRTWEPRTALPPVPAAARRAHS